MLSNDRVIYFPTFCRPPPDIIQRNKFDTLTSSADEIYVIVMYELNDVSFANSKTSVVQLTAKLHSIVNMLFKSCFISDVIVLFVDEIRAWLCVFLALKLMFVVVSELIYLRDRSLFNGHSLLDSVRCYVARTLAAVLFSCFWLYGSI